MAATALGIRKGRLSPHGTTSYSEVSRPVFYVFLFYVLFLYLQGGIRFPQLGEIRLEMLMGLVLGPMALFTFLKRPDKDTGGVLGWATALLVTMLVMVLLSHYVSYSWGIFWDRSFKFSIFGLCIAAFVTNPRDLRWFFGAFLFAFLKMGQEGMLGTLNGSLIWENQEIPRLHGSTPNYVHPNSFSGTQLGTLAYLYYFYPLLPWYGKAVLAIQAILCGNVVLRTGSRTGYLAFLIAVSCMIWMTKKRFKAIVVTVLVSLIAVPLIPAEYMGRFESIFEDNSVAGADTSIGQRKEILNDATNVFFSHPFGIGVGAFPLVRSQLFGRYQDTHNLYLEVLTNMGVQGFIVFLGFVLCVWRVLRRQQTDIDAQLQSLLQLKEPVAETLGHIGDLRFMLAAARATWVFLIVRLALGAFGMDMYEVYWWFLAGSTIAIVRINNVARSRTRLLLQSQPGKPAHV